MLVARGWESVCSGDRASVWEDEKVLETLEMDGSDGHTTARMYLVSLN